jgi:hypothetical protein
VSCSASADDHDRELVRLSFLIVVVRLGIDPTGAIGTSCIVRTSLNDAAIDHRLTDLVLT